MLKNTIRGAIFDIDGTLFDSMPIWLDAGARYLRQLGKDPAPDLAETLWEMSVPEGIAYLREAYRLPMTVEEIREGFFATIRDFYYYEVPLKAGVRELLEKLKREGIPMAIATASDRSYLERALERLEITDYFRTMITCEEAGAGKSSSTAVYDMAAEVLGSKPSETLVFEDVIHALRMAKSGGYRVVAVFDQASASDWPAMQKEADIAVRTMEELL